MSTTREAAIEAAKRITKLWRAAAWDELAPCFAEEIVQVGPRLKELSRGRSAAIEGYRAFTSGARLLEYHEENFRSEAWSDFATVVYEWRMRYIAEGERRFSSGTDQFIFQEVAGRLHVVWRFVDFWEDRAEREDADQSGSVR
jgi:hypothetical protein